MNYAVQTPRKMQSRVLLSSPEAFIFSLKVKHSISIPDLLSEGYLKGNIIFQGAFFHVFFMYNKWKLKETD